MTRRGLVRSSLAAFVGVSRFRGHAPKSSVYFFEIVSSDVDNYRSRLVDKTLRDELEAFGAVLITGPKWCGKTTAASRLSKSIIRMQDPDELDEIEHSGTGRINTVMIGTMSFFESYDSNGFILPSGIRMCQILIFRGSAGLRAHAYEQEGLFYIRMA